MKKFPLRRQHDSMQCGVACLQMLCSYFGKEYPLEELDRLCRATNRGVSLLGISHAASELGKTAGGSFQAVYSSLEAESFRGSLPYSARRQSVLYCRSRKGPDGIWPGGILVGMAQCQ